tara:strand:- start:5566 stop:6132 length:567 start_codon:yes stop_codon:yes gene_type:complete
MGKEVDNSARNQLLAKQNYTLEDINRIEEFRESLLNFEKQLVNAEGSYGKASKSGSKAGLDEVANKTNPLVHTFGDGFYMRNISMPKGQLITTGIHKKEHPFFVMKGDVSVLTEDGVHRIKAPYNGITQPGTKRLIYTHEDTVWITVHITDAKTIEEVHDDVMAEDFNDPAVSLEKAKEMLRIKSDKS